MSFTTTHSIKNNFCKDKELTRVIVGKLKDREVKVLATGSILGRFLHKLRYLFSKDYHRKFDEVVTDLLNTKVTTNPKTPVPAFNHLKQEEAKINTKDTSKVSDSPAAPAVPPIAFVPANSPFKTIASDETVTPDEAFAPFTAVKVNTPVASVEPVQKKNPLPKEMDPLLEEIGKSLNHQAAILWRTLFTRFAEDRNYGVDFLAKDTNGNYKVEKINKSSWELTFSKPLKMHLVSKEIVDGKEVEDPPGGIVMIFGHNNKPLKITIKNGEMQFEGLQTFSKTPPSMAKIPGFTKLVGNTVDARFMSFKSLGGDQFEITAGKETRFKNFTKSNIKTFAKILENWGTKATILASNTEPASVILKK